MENIEFYYGGSKTWCLVLNYGSKRLTVFNFHKVKRLKNNEAELYYNGKSIGAISETFSKLLEKAYEKFLTPENNSKIVKLSKEDL